jgi:hypothetical protein
VDAASVARSGAIAKPAAVDPFPSGLQKMAFGFELLGSQLDSCLLCGDIGLLDLDASL